MYSGYHLYEGITSIGYVKLITKARSKRKADSLVLNYLKENCIKLEAFTYCTCVDVDDETINYIVNHLKSINFDKGTKYLYIRG